MTVTDEAPKVDLGSGFTAHAKAMMAEWLTTFSLRGVPLGGAVVEVMLTVDGFTHLLWSNPDAETPALPKRRAAKRAMDMFDDPWHSSWASFGNELWTITGPEWMHPETRLVLGDGYATALRGGAHLYLGVCPRENPSAGRSTYRSDLDPGFHDIGVFAFPFHLAPVFELVEAGWNMTEVARRSLVAAVVDACCHEALEMWQIVPGQPVLVPHDSKSTVEATVSFGSGSALAINPTY